jgi:pyridoxal biosynthesis lyase PdxS
MWIFVSVSAVPFGIFNYENLYLVQIQALRAHLFETNDAAHKSNVTETVMHLRMANEEISQLLQNLSTSEIISNQDSHKLNNTLNLVQMQLSEINTLDNNNNLFISNFTNS